MKRTETRWARYTRAAVGAGQGNTQAVADPRPSASTKRGIRMRLQTVLAEAREPAAPSGVAAADNEPRRRPDLRLLPAAAGTWGVAMAGGLPVGSGAILWSGAAALLACLLLVVWSAGKGRRAVHPRAVHPRGAQRRRGLRRGTAALPAARASAAAPALALAILCMGAVLLSAGLRLQALAAPPLAEAVARGQPLALVLEVDTAPRRMEAREGGHRVFFTAFIVQGTDQGRTLEGRVKVRVVAGAEWAQLQERDRATTAGSVEPAAGTDAAAGVLRPDTVPQNVTAAANGTQQAVSTVRGAWVGAVQKVWGGSNADVAGLLPGMVMGERSGLAPALQDSMKTVGLTHLTAVSGANCTLVLASLLLLLRTARAPRWAAFAASLAGLGLFVLVVGPDPSVLRAAVMGSIGAMALLSGRPKRVGVLLAVCVVLLLLMDPWLATDYAFILSVLATLGLHLVGQRCVAWLSVWLPLWLAQAVAIPLAAQLFCAPVIVLLQPRLTPYTLVANMLAAPVVVLVTTVGTLGLAMAWLVPHLGELCAAVAGAGSWWVAAVARTMAAWPGSSLPWPGGVQGVFLMAVFNGAVVLALAAVVERQRARSIMAWIIQLLPTSWRPHGLGLLATAAAAAAAWWSAAALGS